LCNVLVITLKCFKRTSNIKSFSNIQLFLKAFAVVSLPTFIYKNCLNSNSSSKTQVKHSCGIERICLLTFPLSEKVCLKTLLPGDNLAIESYYMIVEQQLPMISFFSSFLASSFDSN
jgi:hypothetical protein